MITGGLVLVAFIAILTIGNSPSTSDAGSPATSTTVPPVTARPTTTLAVPTTIVTREAPELGELLPEFTAGLNAVIERDDGTVAVARWRLNRRFPQFTELPGGVGVSGLDASGGLVATLGSGSFGDSPGLLSVGPVVLGVQPVFVSGGSFEWHATQPGLLAVVGRQPTDDAMGLFIMEFDPSGVLVSSRRIRDAGPTWVVSGFHDAGIAVVDNDIGQPVLRVIDTSGAELASTAGFSGLTTDNLIVGAGDPTLGFVPMAWTWGLEASDVVPSFFEGGASGLPEIVSPDGRHGAVITRAITSTILVRSEDFSGPRSVGVPAAISDAFFLTDDHIAVFSASADTLFIIEWRSGIIAEFELEGSGLRDINAPGYPPEPETAETPPGDADA
jgi:hypothetical protein